MADINGTLEQMDHWLGDIHGAMQRLLDLQEPMPDVRRCEELLKMSQRFLALSKTFLQMGQQASAAAETLMEDKLPKS